jgi:hypothetical protein
MVPPDARPSPTGFFAIPACDDERAKGFTSHGAFMAGWCDMKT